MNFLPKELEDIIVDYKEKIETATKYKKCLRELKNNFTYELDYYHGDMVTIRIHKNKSVEYYNNDFRFVTNTYYPNEKRIGSTTRFGSTIKYRYSILRECFFHEILNQRTVLFR